MARHPNGSHPNSPYLARLTTMACRLTSSWTQHYGKGFGGETKNDRSKAKRAKEKNEPLPTCPYQAQTNFAFGGIVQDSKYHDWMVVGEAHVHEGLPSRCNLSFAKERLLGPLSIRSFNDTVYIPIIKEALEFHVCRYSPRHRNIHAAGPQLGVFTYTEPDERLIKNVRVTAKLLAHTLHSPTRQKIITGLSKLGYWIPQSGWETYMHGQAFDSLLHHGHLPAEKRASLDVFHTTEVDYASCVASIFHGWMRYPMTFRFAICFSEFMPT